MSEEQDVNTSESAEATSSEAKQDAVLEVLTNDEDEAVVDKDEAEPVEKPESESEESADDSEEPPEDKEESEEKPQGRADKRKEQVSSEIRGLVAQRNALKQEVEKLNSEVYKPQSAEELEAEGYSATDAKVAALEQKLELSEFNNRVVEVNMALGEESQRVLSEFPEFNPYTSDGSINPDYDKDIAEEAAALLEANLIRDPNTKAIIGYHATPYQIYKPIAMANRKSKVEGQIKGQKATEKMLSSVDPQASASPKPKKVDPVLAILSSDD